MITKPFYERHPFLFVALLQVVQIVVPIAIFNVLKTVELPAFVPEVVARSSLTVIAAFLLTRQRWWRETGFRPPYEARLLWLFWLPALPVVLRLFEGVQTTTTDPARIALILVFALLVGFDEEAFYRGLMLRAMLPKGIWAATIVSVLLFGLSHFVNILTQGQNWLSTIGQVLYTTTIYGFAGAALVIYTRTLFPLVAIHFLTDFILFLEVTGTIQATGFIGGLPLVTLICLSPIYGTILLVLAARRGLAVEGLQRISGKVDSDVAQ